jgi:ectoine hydroxylase-related dioxygenase (phytanoyl-CoA dioxygenase family)
VFAPEEMDRLSAETDRWRVQMTPEDERAWYATVGDEQVCVRVTGLRGSDVDFPFAERLAPIAALTGAGHRFYGSDLLVKPVGVSAGISDLPWHKDCALGLHSYRCISLTCGVAITASGADNGQLGVLAGSHRVNIPLFDLQDEVDLPAIYFTTEPGDVTVHLSCALHCATPPRHTERRVAYSGFRLPGDLAELDEKIRAVRDQAGRETYAPA